MKISEVTGQPARIKHIRPGVEVEIDNQDGTSTKIDLRKNPSALRKNTRGEIELARDDKDELAKARNIRPGDIVKKPDENNRRS